MSASPSPSAHLRALGPLLADVRDVLGERVLVPTPPAWSERRGWTAFLLGLDDATLERCEHGDTAARLASLAEAPASLRELASSVRSLTELPRLEASASPQPLRRAGARKRQQVAALGDWASRWHPRAGRIVDVGAGHGHLTRELARALGLEALGVEERAHVVANTRALTAGERVRFVHGDALTSTVQQANAPDTAHSNERTLTSEIAGVDDGARELALAEPVTAGDLAVGPHARGALGIVRSAARTGELALAEPVSAGDLVVGLHACGALGDAIVRSAARAGAGVLLVSCCPQKITAPERQPLSALGRALGLRIAREHLGLANRATLAQGGVDSAAVMERRRTRYALWLLLREAGVDVAPGDEADGMPRRWFRRPLVEVAARAFAQRAVDAPSVRACEDALARATAEHARVRRLALPRTMLARALELAIVLDRAVALEEAGGEPPLVAEAFERDASPRNLAIARAPRSPCARGM